MREGHPAANACLLVALGAGLLSGCGGIRGEPARAAAPVPDAADAAAPDAADAGPVTPPVAECPHAAPANGSPCEPPGYAACTYPADDPGCARVIATCRGQRWSVECLPERR